MNIKNNETEFLVEKPISLKTIIKFIWHSKFSVILITLLATLISIFISLNMPNIYTSKTVLTVIDHEGSSSPNFGSLGGLVGLSGVSFSSSKNNNTQEAISTLRSLKFFEQSFMNEIRLENLMAVKKWESSRNVIIYDPNEFNVKKNTWLESGTYLGEPPSVQQAHRKFIDDHFNIIENKSTGIIEIHVEHESPFIAKSWLEIILRNINEVARAYDKKKSTNAVRFLNEQIKNTSYTEVKTALASLLEQEVEKLSLIEANEEYLFKTIDPPFVPEIKSKPKRSQIVLIGFLFGILLSLCFIFFKNRYIQKTNEKKST